MLINLYVLAAISVQVCYCWISGFHKADPEEPLFKPCPLLDKLVAEGKLGRKTGQGFYSYDKDKKWILAFSYDVFWFFSCTANTKRQLESFPLIFLDFHSMCSSARDTLGWRWLQDIPLRNSCILLFILTLEITEYTNIILMCVLRLCLEACTGPGIVRRSQIHFHAGHLTRRPSVVLFFKCSFFCCTGVSLVYWCMSDFMFGEVSSVPSLVIS